MDKVFNLEIDGQITLPDGSKLGPLYETPINIRQPSGGWPDDLPKPSVGGYGWTESGEQTVIVDNESITTVADRGLNYGLFATPFNIVEGAYTVIFNGTEYNLNSTFAELGETVGYYLGEIAETGPDFSRYPFLIVNDGESENLYTEFAGDYDVTVKKSSDTINKIDEKYLPASSGAIVHYINTQYDESEDSFVNRLVYNPDDVDTEFSEQTKEKFLDWNHMKNLVGTTAIDEYGDNRIIMFTSKNGRVGGSCVILSPYDFSENITAISSDFIAPR